MLKKVSLTAIIALTAYIGFSQDSASTKPSVVISGGADAYYRYNFGNASGYMHSNNFTSFTNSQNSFELGMASIKADLTAGKIQGVIDLGFGRRAQEFSYNDMDGDAPTALAFIKQAYISYSPSEKLKFTMGKWGTHVGYELLDPQLNRNYSMSYMFSYGPFFHTGLKADVKLNDNFGLMVGVANPTDYAAFDDASKFVLGQVSASFDKFSAYLNYVGGSYNDGVDVMGNQFGLTALATISDKFSIGYDGTVKSVKYKGSDANCWWGSALYLNVDPVEKFGLTLRGEYFSDKKNVTGYFQAGPAPDDGLSIFATTLSLNLKPSEYLTIIPEFRLDSASEEFFAKKDGNSFTGKKNTGTFMLAAVFHF